VDGRIRDPIRKSPSATDAERFLAQLCEKTFLSLWSYPCVFQDQGVARTGEGKELCDLLVVFGRHVLIFSDKHCGFPDTGNLDLDWSRWYKRAVLRAADQLWGAERWLKEHPDRLFIDRTCKKRFPVSLPSRTDVQYHLIVVAHGSTAAGRQKFGGSGGLIVTNQIAGEKISKKPFTTGDLDGTRSFVHVFDDASLPVTLQALDTISDFVGYLVAKESLLRSSTPVLARAEEDMVAVYLTTTDESSARCFPSVPCDEGMFIDEGQWQALLKTNWWRHEQELNDVSFAWDHMIESFAGHTLNDTRQFSYPHDDFGDSETVLHFLAREPRASRRILAQIWLQALVKSEDGNRYTRWLVPTVKGQPYWVFLFFPRIPTVTYERYREIRATALEACCRVTKLKYPAAEDIVGIASESGLNHVGRSEDAMYFNARQWEESDTAKALEMQRIFDLMTDAHTFTVSASDYDTRPTDLLETLKRSVVEGPCPCGSGRNYQECHMAAT
jgi:SEC-C motif